MEEEKNNTRIEYKKVKGKTYESFMLKNGVICFNRDPSKKRTEKIF
jgi:hypothetical protein